MKNIPAFVWIFVTTLGLSANGCGKQTSLAGTREYKEINNVNSDIN